MVERNGGLWDEEEEQEEARSSSSDGRVPPVGHTLTQHGKRWGSEEEEEEEAAANEWGAGRWRKKHRGEREGRGEEALLYLVEGWRRIKGLQEETDDRRGHKKVHACLSPLPKLRSLSQTGHGYALHVARCERRMSDVHPRLTRPE